MELIIICRSRQAILKFAFATLILIKRASTRYYIIKKIQRFCHRMVCTNKKHIEFWARRTVFVSTATTLSCTCCLFFFLNNFQLYVLVFCSPYSIAFLRYNLAFSLYLITLKYLIPLLCHDAITPSAFCVEVMSRLRH